MDPYISKKEIAAERHISEKTIEAWVRAGRFPQGERIGPKMRRWRQSVVDAAFEAMANMEPAR